MKRLNRARPAFTFNTIFACAAAWMNPANTRPEALPA